MAGSVLNLSSAIQYYAEMGFDSLPLLPGTKRAGVKAWQSRPTSQLWEEAGLNSNIGIRCGGKSQLAVIDCDDKEKPGTADAVLAFLYGLGLYPGHFPLVKTASGNGRHIYLRAKEIPQQSNYCHLSKAIGAGEFRYGQGAYVVAPPSIVGAGYSYSLIDGDFQQLPDIQFRDLLPIIQSVPESEKKPGLYNISRLAWGILLGNYLERYPSRSEAEQAAIASLINTGHDYNSIERLFHKYPAAGKFQEKLNRNPDEAHRYLRTSYKSAIEWTKNNISQGRQIAEHAKEWALSRTWKGRTGTYDREVFLAHVQIAWECGKVVYGASSRELAEKANISHTAATNATRRLLNDGFIRFEESAVARYANRYSLGNTFTLPQLQPVRECKGIFNFEINHEVFCYQGLTKSSKLILMELDAGPKTEKELVTLTGKTLPTIKKWLKFMSKILDVKTGEIISLVYNEGDNWFKITPCNLDRVAEVLNVAGIQKQRKRIHEQQRENHKRGLDRGRMNGDCQSM